MKLAGVVTLYHPDEGVLDNTEALRESEQRLAQ